MAAPIKLITLLAGLAQAQPQRRLEKRNQEVTAISASAVVGLLFVAIIVVMVVTWFGHIAHTKQKFKQGNHPDQLRVLRRQWYQGRAANRARFRDEGLNDDGFAPPPYLPKPSQEQLSVDGEGQEHGAGIAVPMQTLSRDQVGALPPDYTGAAVQERLSRRERQQLIDEVNAPVTKIPRPEEQEVHEQ